MKKIEDILEISDAKGARKTRPNNTVPKSRRWGLWTPLFVFLFIVVGTIGIVLSWIIFSALVVDESLLLPLIAMLNIITPSVLWIFVLLLTRNREQVTKNRVRIQSAIGFFIAIGVAYVLLMPWAFFVIAFRDIRM